MANETNETKSIEAALPSAKSLAEKAANDTEWKREPVVDDDGREIRTQRVKNADGTYTVFKAKCVTKRYPAKSER